MMTDLYLNRAPAQEDDRMSGVARVFFGTAFGLSLVAILFATPGLATPSAAQEHNRAHRRPNGRRGWRLLFDGRAPSTAGAATTERP